MTVRKYVKGKDGRVYVGTDELEVTQHESTGKIQLEEIGTSASDGFTVAIDGNKSCSGTVQGKISSEQVLADLLQEGDIVELKLYLTESAEGTNKKIYRHFPEAKISEVMMGSDPNGGGGSAFSFSFVNHGPYYTKHES